ncbi:MAG: hypothetical protein ACR2QJ_10990 [Geminicoccaceae bacterium]
MNRRRLIKLAGLSLAGLALPAAWLPRLRADTLFADIFGDISVAADMGRLYQKSVPEAGRRGRAIVAELAAFRLRAREQRLRERTQADLAALDVVVVDGWVMARSEAELCAAVYLDGSQA